MKPESPRPPSTGHQLSLAGQLLLLIGVLSLGPLVVTNYYGYQRSRSLIEELSTQSLQNAARVAANETASFVQERQRLVRSIVAGNVHLADSALRAADEHGSAVPSGAEPSALEHHLQAKASEADETAVFYVIRADGLVLGSSAGAEVRGERRVDDTCLRVVERPDGTGLSHAGAPMLHIAQPIPPHRGRQPGVLCARYALSIRQDLGHLAASQSSVGRFHIVDKTGQTLAGAADQWVEPTELAAVLRPHVNAVQPWAGSYTGDDAQTRFAAVEPVAALGWSIVAEVLESEAMVVLDDLKRRVFWMGSGFVLIVLLGMIFMVRRTIGPLRDLVAATRNMTRGQLAQRVQTRGPREVAELAEGFNQMSRRVAELYETLEERVEQRTEQLRRNQELSELLFDSMHENLAVIEDDCVVVQANQAALDTYGDDIIGKRYFEAFEQRPQPADDCPILEVLQAHSPLACERVHDCKGSREIVSLELFPLPGHADNGADRLLMVARKITDQKQEQAHEVHGQKVSAYALMAASVAHEIGNPLSSISAQTQLAVRRDDPEYTKKVLDIVGEEVERISRLLRDITKFAGRQHTQETLVSWNQVASDAVRLLRHDPRGRFAEFELDLADDLPTVKAHPDHCMQVLINLGLNGLDAMEGRGVLHISTDVEAGEVLVRITDEGPGVPEELGEQIFEPYVSTKDCGENSGLGLFISRRIVEQMGGSLEHEQRPGAEASTTFVVRMAVPEAARGQSPAQERV